MSFKQRCAELEARMAWAKVDDDTAQHTALSCELDGMYAVAWDEACARASELDGPNSLDYDNLCESIFEEITS